MLKLLVLKKIENVIETNNVNCVQMKNNKMNNDSIRENKIVNT